MEKIDGLLAKYMLGEASAEEIRSIDEWLAASDDNVKYFNHFKLIWETSKSLAAESTLDVDASWEEFKQAAINKPQTKVISLSKNLRWMKIAALWFVFFGAAALLYVVLNPVKPVMLALQTTGNVETDTLSDGSVITLNKNTRISYPEKFTGDTREIALNKGEAFFNIAHNKSKPFLIHVNNAVVKVVGTSFNIKIDTAKTVVIVETGIVQVISKKVTIRLKPQDKADIDNSTATIKKETNTDQLYNYYRTKQLFANKTPLWRVVEVLNEAYHSNIVIANKNLENRTLTTTLILDSLDQNLSVIQETFNVHITRSADKIIIQ
jgi:transmembrane sensor